MIVFNGFKSYLVRFFSNKPGKKTPLPVNAPVYKFKFPKIKKITKPNPDDDNDTSDDTGRPFRLGS